MVLKPDLTSSTPDEPVVSEKGALIPKIFHRIWYQGLDQLPPKYQGYLRTWEKHYPNWEHRYWDGPQMRSFMETSYPEWLDLFDSYPLDIQRIDAVRYFLLHKFGGFYFDMDMQSLRPIDLLLENHRLILSYTQAYNNACMGSVPGHPLWEKVFSQLPAKFEEGNQKRRKVEKKWNTFYVAETTGPAFFSQCVTEGGFDNFPGTCILPSYIFEPGVPVVVNGVVTRKLEYDKAFVRHDGDGKWHHPLTRLLSFLSKGLFKLYWAFKKGG